MDAFLLGHAVQARAGLALTNYAALPMLMYKY